MKLPKAYEPKDYEPNIYSLWEETGAFQPKPGKGYFSMVAPPPNANAPLHIGYGMTIALEDIATRYNRLRGKSTLFVPGADHAGFETQVVYEKHLAKAGKSRFDFTREELYDGIWDFVTQNRGSFETQFRALGASVDWTKFTFTLDEKVIKTAYDTFKKMWDKGLIYRGERLVNYCTQHRTGFADIEVVYEDAVTPLYYMKYGPFTVATTRPETKFGDTAVAVNPKDKRYQKWVGQVIEVEGVNGSFQIKVIADEMVDMDFGTGVVKITPAHDMNDWEAAQRHNLPAVKVINPDGTLNDIAGRFEGLSVTEARQAVVEALEDKGLLVRVDENYRNRVGKCYKCGTVIEPMLMEQWFVDMKPLTKPAIKALRAGEITFYPDAKRDQLIGYLEGLRDWNISRQIAWGIPIPAFQNVEDPDDWIFDTRVSEESIVMGDKTYRRDPDVFDTWFSSSSWPYATLDFPDGEAYKQFYPLSLMETGGEILYPWVSRMLMMGLYMTGKVPFKAVYIHGYVMAEDGSKMSKSVGNTIDLGEVLKEYGSDALRMGIVAGRSPAVNRGYDRRRVEEARNFCNKLWNIARFIEGQAGDDFMPSASGPQNDVDNWMLSRLQHITEAVTADLDDYRFAEAYEKIYHLVWDDFADWYIEASKAALNLPLLTEMLKMILIVAHPFAPFVTETIWQTLRWTGSSVLANEAWPAAITSDTKAANHFETLKDIVVEIRNLRALLKPERLLLHHDGSLLKDADAAMVKRLAGLDDISQVPLEGGIQLTSSKQELRLDISDEEVAAYRARLKQRRVEQERLIGRLESRLKNKSYVQNAPAKVVKQTEEQLAEAKELLTTLEQEARRF